MTSPYFKLPRPGSPGWNQFWQTISEVACGCLVHCVKVSIPGVPTDEVCVYHHQTGLKFISARFNKNKDDGSRDNGRECVVMWLLGPDDSPMYIDDEPMSTVESDGDLDETRLHELMRHMNAIFDNM
jgi:hypothetical protein